MSKSNTHTITHIMEDLNKLVPELSTMELHYLYVMVEDLQKTIRKKDTVAKAVIRMERNENI